jgi:diguanylate cyclase (GGDEF)-like protein
MRSARAGIRTQGARRKPYRLIHLALEVYLLAALVVVVPIGVIVAGVHFESPLLLSLAGQPGELALAGLEDFRKAFLPTLYAILGIALLGAFLFARRILNPLARMLDVTQGLASRDAWGRADLRRQSKYRNLSNHLKFMADDVAQQFNARKTLSSIDQVILSGADITLIVDIVLRHIVESVHCRRATVTILGDESSGAATAVSMSHGHPVARKSDLKLSEEQRRWLATQGNVVEVTRHIENSVAEPFIAADAPSALLLPIKADGRIAAAVSIVTKDGLGLDDGLQSHVRDLAGRLAVALEAVSRAERLRRKAYFDDLTGLPNRDFCFARLDRAIKQAKHLETAVAVMFIDLDGFKGINDSLGHIAGDELIRQAAFRLSNCVSEAGTVGRLGGDEFAVVLPFPINKATPAKMSERLIATLAQPFNIGSAEIHVTASIGVARFPEDGDTRAELLRKADTAMYRAKETGRGRYVDYSNTMGIKVDERLRIESELRRALDSNEFVLYYQPQMDMRNGRIVSAEALLRWQHPTDGLVLPEKFVAIAEDAGFIPVLGRWVLGNACDQLAAWREQGLDLPRVSVNVSARQFRHHDFIEVVESCLLTLLADAKSLEIELTESVFVDDLANARRTLERLKATGVYISVDDFGTGYSSLGYLKHLTFDAVKVDKSFIHELPDDRKSEAIIRAVLAMCHTLDKVVVAEGIETDAQFHYLRKAGVDVGQGFRIGHPMPAAEFAEFLGLMRQKAEARRLEQPRRVAAGSGP